METNKLYRFIVVEDSKTQRIMMEHVLQVAFPGCIVENFDNGKDAITRIQSNNFDMVLTDLHLNIRDEYNGWSVMECAYYAGKPVIILSGASILERAKLWTKYSAFNKNRIKFLAKPVTVENILKNVLDIVNNNEEEITILRRLTNKLRKL